MMTEPKMTITETIRWTDLEKKYIVHTIMTWEGSRRVQQFASYYKNLDEARRFHPDAEVVTIELR